MSYKEAVTFASQHNVLIGQKVNYDGQACTVARFYIETIGDGCVVNVLLLLAAGGELIANLESFLPAYQL